MFGVLLVFGGMLAGQVERPADTSAMNLEVRRLVRQLNAPRKAERDAAEERLTALGPAVLDHLPPPSETMAAEEKLRLGRIRQALQQQQARAVAQGSTVTLQADAMPLSEILAALEAQSGNKIAGGAELKQRGFDPALKASFDKTLFWHALDQVLDQAKLTVYSFGEDKAVTLRPQIAAQPPRCGRAHYQGPFRFEPTSVEARRDLRDPAQQSLSVVLEVAWEPRLAPISLQLPLDRLEAVDENGNRLPVDGRQAEWEIPVTPESMAKDLRIPLALPPRSVKQIAQLKGTMTALIPGKVETFRFENLEGAKDVEKRVAGVTVILEGVRKREKIHEVRVRVRFDDAAESLQSHRTWIFDNEVHLEGPDGKPIAWGTYETTRRTENEVGVAYFFDLEKLAGHTLVYKTPGAILSAEVPFEIKEIPLP